MSKHAKLSFLKLKKKLARTNSRIKLVILFCATLMLISLFWKHTTAVSESQSWWQFQSIDTMKYSRDLSREKLKDTGFIRVIDQQLKNIAGTGATHVAIATPYDEEFLPILMLWVNTARSYDLNVWFRGNWSGWEGWFDYPDISREEHINKTNQFIMTHKDLFVDGDVFSACPECENGGPGDPRSNGDTKGHRKFLIDEYKVTQQAFAQIGIDVKTNYNSMNGDVARLIMDKETTKLLGGVVVIDHYVGTSEKLIKDIVDLANQSGGNIILGEFGAPIPDIHGRLSESEQAQWIDEALDKLSELPEVKGLNYWVNVGGTTELWTETGKAKKVVQVLTSYFKPKEYRGRVLNEIGQPITGAVISMAGRQFVSGEDGKFTFFHKDPSVSLALLAPGYFNKDVIMNYNDLSYDIILVKKSETGFFKLFKFVHQLWY